MPAEFGTERIRRICRFFHANCPFASWKDLDAQSILRRLQQFRAKNIPPQAGTQPRRYPKRTSNWSYFHQTFINSRIIFYLCPSLVAVIGSPFRFQLRKEKPPYATPLYNRGLMNLTRKIFEFHAVSKLWPGEGLLPGENRHPSSGSGANPRNARACSQCLPDNPGQEHSISGRSAANVQPAPRSTPTWSSAFASAPCRCV